MRRVVAAEAWAVRWWMRPALSVMHLQTSQHVMFPVLDAHGATVLWNILVWNIAGWSPPLPFEILDDQTKVKRSGLEKTPGSYTEHPYFDCLASAVARWERF